METLNDVPIYSFADANKWELWLAKHFDLQSGVWLKIAKKATGISSVTHAEALDVALCYGWIDGQGKPLDDAYYLQKFTPRRPKSLWSQVNISKVESFIAAGKMQAPGLAAINAAKADGRWNAAYASQKNATIPPELAAAFAKNKQAKQFFDSINKTNQYSVIWRVVTAKTATLKAARIQKLITMLQEGKTFHPQSTSPKDK